MPIQGEADESITSPGREIPPEKNCRESSDSQNDDDVYYIPLGGQEGKIVSLGSCVVGNYLYELSICAVCCVIQAMMVM